MHTLRLIDSHTGGEPTRTIWDVEPKIEAVSAADRLNWLRGAGDWIRRASVLEPRGSESMVGALIGPPVMPENTATVVFFNNVGYLGMCGHGLIGVVETLRYQGRIGVGVHNFETPVGTVRAELTNDRTVRFENVPSYRFANDVTVNVSVRWPWGSADTVTGDIAYGGNWFFLIDVPETEFADVETLTRCCINIRKALQDSGITGRDRAEIDHIELSGPNRNFVLCPGGHYDRSPCGTGTSAKVACLAAAGQLAPGEIWTQKSIIGSQFQASYRQLEQSVAVTVTGRANVIAETTCVFDETDPFRFGITDKIVS